MKLVILAAGHATRMYPFSDAIPKSLMPVGGKPVIRWIVDKWAPHVDDIIICINNEDFDLFNHEFRDVRKVDFSCSSKPLGTAGEVENAKDLLNEGFCSFILHYGDIITDINVEDFKFYHIMRYLDDYCRREDKYMGTLVLIKEKLENSIVKVYTNTIYSFEEKPTSDNYGWGAIAMFTARIFEYIDYGKDFGRDIFPKILNDGNILGAYISNSKWYNTGDVKNWEIADKAAREGII